MEEVQWLGTYLKEGALRVDQRHIGTPYTDTFYTETSDDTNNLYYTAGYNGISTVYGFAVKNHVVRQDVFINGISIHTTYRAMDSGEQPTLTDAGVSSYLVGLEIAPLEALQARAHRLGRTVTIKEDRLHPSSFAALEYICTQPVLEDVIPQTTSTGPATAAAGIEPRTLRYITLSDGDGNITARNFPVPVDLQAPTDNDALQFGVNTNVSKKSVFTSQRDYEDYKKMHMSNVMYMEGHGIRVPPLDHGYLTRVINGEVQFPGDVSATEQQARHTAIFIASYFKLPTVPAGNNLVRYLDMWARAQRHIISNSNILAPDEAQAPALHEHAISHAVSASNLYNVSFLAIQTDDDANMDDSYIFDSTDDRRYALWPTKADYDASRTAIFNVPLVPVFGRQVRAPPLGAVAASEFILNSDLYLRNERGYPAFNLNIHLWLAREYRDLEVRDTNELFRRWLADVRGQLGMDTLDRTALNLFPAQVDYGDVRVDSTTNTVLRHVPMPMASPVLSLDDDTPSEWEPSRAWPTYRHWHASVMQAQKYRALYTAKQAISVTSLCDLVALKVMLSIETDAEVDTIDISTLTFAEKGRVASASPSLTVQEVMAAAENNQFFYFTVAGRKHVTIRPYPRSDDTLWPTTAVFPTAQEWDQYIDHVFGQQEAVHDGFINVPVDTPLASLFAPMTDPMPFTIERWLFFYSVLTVNNSDAPIVSSYKLDTVNDEEWDKMVQAGLAVLFSGSADLVCDYRNVNIVGPDPGVKRVEVLAIPRSSGWANAELTVNAVRGIGNTTITASSDRPWIGSITWPNVEWWTRAVSQYLGFETEESLIPLLKPRVAAYAYANCTGDDTLHNYSNPAYDAKAVLTEVGQLQTQMDTHDPNSLLRPLQLLNDVSIPFPYTVVSADVVRAAILGSDVLLRDPIVVNYLVLERFLKNSKRTSLYHYREAFKRFRLAMDKEFQLTPQFWTPETPVFPSGAWELQTTVNEPAYWKPKIPDLCRLWPRIEDWEETFRLAQARYHPALRHGSITDLSTARTAQEKIALRIAIGFVLGAPFRPVKRHMVSDLALMLKLDEANRRLASKTPDEADVEPVAIEPLRMDGMDVNVNVPTTLPSDILQGCLNGDSTALIEAHEMWHTNSVWNNIEDWVATTRAAFSYIITDVKKTIREFALPLDIVGIAISAQKTIHALPKIGSSGWKRITQFFAHVYGTSLDIYTHMRPYICAVGLWLKDAARRFARVAWQVTRRMASEIRKSPLFAAEAFRAAVHIQEHENDSIEDIKAETQAIIDTITPEPAIVDRRRESPHAATFIGARSHADTSEKYINSLVVLESKKLRTIEKTIRPLNKEFYFTVFDTVADKGMFKYGQRLPKRSANGNNTVVKPDTVARRLLYPKGVNFDKISNFLNDPIRIGSALGLLDKPEDKKAITRFLDVLIEPSSGEPDSPLLKLLAWRQAVRKFAQLMKPTAKTILILYLSRDKYGLFSKTAVNILVREEKKRLTEAVV